MKIANMKKRYCFLGCLALLSTSSATAVPNVSDLPAGHWSVDAVLSMINLRVFGLYSDGTFRGLANLTRYEQSEILFNLANALYAQGSIDAKFIRLPKGNLFSDVGGARSFYATWAGQNEILFGYPDGTFRGQDLLTRYDFITSIYRLAQNTLYFEENKGRLVASMSDVPAGHWAIDAIQWGVARNLLLGYPDGTFRGTQIITRYEAVEVLDRMYRNVVNKGN